MPTVVTRAEPHNQVNLFFTLLNDVDGKNSQWLREKFSMANLCSSLHRQSYTLNKIGC